MIVVDASLITDLLLRAAGVEAIEVRLQLSDSLHSPHLLDIEVAHPIRRHTALGQIEAEVGREALADLSVFPLHRYPHTELLQRIWEIRGNISAYDATYVALAEALDATLLTRDQKLAAALGHRARVELI